MKKIYIIFALLLLPVLIIAQSTDAFNYQAAVRDQSGQIIANKAVNFRISLLKDNPTGFPVYSETHLVLTNDFGLVNLEIGHGISSAGDFSKVDWSVNNYYLEVAIDLDGGTDFQVMGSSKLLSVPYALYAKTAGNSFSGNYNDLINKPERLSDFLNDSEFLTISDLQDIISGNPDRDAMAGVPSQTWSLFGNSGTDPETDKLGTTDAADLVLITNNEERLRIQADGDIDLQNSLLIGEDLTVNKNVFLNATGGYTQNFGPFTVENASLSHLTGDLNVDGASELNSTLDVDGASSFHSTLAVDGNADLNSALNVDGAATLNSTLNASGATSLGSTLVVTGATTLNSSLAANGQVTIDATVAGGESAVGAYPLRVQGSDQGIAISVNGTRSNSKNFVTFWDANGRQGRIEGQTSTELHDSFDYIWFHTHETLQTAFQLAMVVVDLIGVDDADAAVVEGIEMVEIIVNWALVSEDMNNNVGVAFESGSGDYAEWLLKANNSELFSYGDIVGVKAGMISKSMEDPDLYLVISMSPIVLGNMPPKGMEDLYEKVAFMGQVPVKVHGKVTIGDYILTSGINDGFGIAVHPEDMTLDQYDRIVGVAWSASADKTGFSYINTAVGINTNDLVGEISRQNEEIEAMQSNMNLIVNYLKSKDPGFDAAVYSIEKQVQPELKRAEEEKPENRAEAIERLISVLQQNPELMQQIMADARNSLDQQGIDYNKYEQSRRLVTDEAYLFEVLRSNAQF